MTLYADLALIAYGIDRLFGEFRRIRHPVVLMGDCIAWYERHFYSQKFLAGAGLALWLPLAVAALAAGIDRALEWALPPVWKTLIEGGIASMAIASKMLHDSVREIITRPSKIRFLVSRDTEGLNRSDINKAAIESYAENLSDGVVAPLFYLLLFGLPGAFAYKAINTLDSMVGYRNPRYERFGKLSARLDDAANLIPSRITALLIVLLMPGRPKETRVSLLAKTFRYGRGHESPNAGYPISAMALALGVRLGGDTYYFGKLKHKPCFGEGRERIEEEDIRRALALQPRLDLVVLFGLGVLAWV